MLMKRQLLILCALIAVLLVAGCGTAVVASVNGEEITRLQLDQEMAQAKAELKMQGFSEEKGEEIVTAMKEDILNGLIERTLLLQEARRLGLEPGEKEVKEEMERIKSGFESEGEYRKLLAAYGTNELKLAEVVRQRLAIENLLKKVEEGTERATEEQARKYYDDNRELFVEPERRRVKHILIGIGENGNGRSEVQAKAEALKIIEQLNSGVSFEELVRTRSDDPGSKNNGGEYIVARNQGYAREFEDAVFSLRPGEITRVPVRTVYGYHIIKLEEIIPARVHPFDEVKDSILKELNDQAYRESFNRYLEDLKKKSDIKVFVTNDWKNSRSGEMKK